jgi:hypothetical protein
MSAFLSGLGAPGDATAAVDGDMYLDTVNERLYGPRTMGRWNGYIALGAQVSVIDNMARVRRITFRRGPAYEWTNENPILGPGEPGFEIDTGYLKIGNGNDEWQRLPYLSGFVSPPPPPTPTVHYFVGGYIDPHYIQ